MIQDNTPVDGASANGGGDAESDSSASSESAHDDIDLPGTETAAAADAVTLAPPAPATANSTGSELPASAHRFETPTVLAPPPDYSQAGVPSLDFVRDKIEGRYAKSLGSTELAQETPEARSFEEQAAKRADAAKEKLDAIRRSLRGDSSS